MSILIIDTFINRNLNNDEQKLNTYHPIITAFHSYDDDNDNDNDNDNQIYKTENINSSSMFHVQDLLSGNSYLI